MPLAGPSGPAPCGCSFFVANAMTTFFSFAFLAASVFGKTIALPMCMLAIHASTQKVLTTWNGTGMELVGILWGTGGDPVGNRWGTGYVFWGTGFWGVSGALGFCRFQGLKIPTDCFYL